MNKRILLSIIIVIILIIIGIIGIILLIPNENNNQLENNYINKIKMICKQTENQR